MLAKCANPACSAKFRYSTKESYSRSSQELIRQEGDRPLIREYTVRPQPVPYFWLRSACRCAVRFRRDGNGGVSVVRNQGHGRMLR